MNKVTSGFNRNVLTKDCIEKGFKLLSQTREKTILKNNKNYIIEITDRCCDMFNPNSQITYHSTGDYWERRNYDTLGREIKFTNSNNREIILSYYGNKNLLRMRKDNQGMSEYYEYDEKDNEIYYVNSEKYWRRFEYNKYENFNHTYDSNLKWTYEFLDVHLKVIGKGTNIQKVILPSDKKYYFSKSRYHNYLVLLSTGDLYNKCVKKMYSPFEISIFNRIASVEKKEEYNSERRKRDLEKRKKLPYYLQNQNSVF